MTGAWQLKNGHGRGVCSPYGLIFDSTFDFDIVTCNIAPILNEAHTWESMTRLFLVNSSEIVQEKKGEPVKLVRTPISDSLDWIGY